MDRTTVDEFCINEEARVRRFAAKAADRDPRAQALTEIAERLGNLAQHRDAVGETHGQWALRTMERVYREAKKREMKLEQLLLVLAGFCGKVIADHAPRDEHDRLISFVKQKADEYRETELGVGEAVN